MRILIANYEYPPLGGGASNASWFMAKALSQQGHEVTVLTSAFGELRGTISEEGVEVVRVPCLRRSKDRSGILEMTSYVVSSFLFVLGMFRKKKFGGVISFFTIPGGHVGWVGKVFFGIPYIVSLRGGDVPGLVPELTRMHRFLTPFRRMLLKQAKAVIANSESLAQLSIAVDPWPVDVVYNGVDADFYCPGEKIGDGVFHLLFVGRFQTQKNLFFLLEQLGQLPKDKNFVLHLVGDGPLGPELKRFALSLGLDDKVVWHGWMDKQSLRTVYQQVDCLVHPTLYEGMPNTILEAMAAGLPVIASNVGGNDNLVIDGETGYLFSLDDAEQFRSRVLDLIDHRDRAVRFGCNGREKVARSYTWDSVASQYMKIFEVGSN